MPYCTIEEAWSQSLNPELNNDLNKDIGSDLGYQNINLKDQELHNSKGKPIRKKKRRNEIEKIEFLTCHVPIIDCLNIMVPKQD